MTAHYRIRPAMASDIESVAMLERTMQDAPHWSVADYLASLAPSNGMPVVFGIRRCFFVAETDSRIVGFSVGRATVLETEAVAELESVAVMDSARRAGIGRALCEAVIVWALQTGAAEIDLEVRGRSEGAITLYSILGFVKTGLRARYYREPSDDAVLMRLALTDKQLDGAAASRDL